jgi:transcriptional regulator with XRE-family HTH domain
MTFGARLRELRQNKGMTQAELAKALALGESTISFYEADRREPDYQTLNAVADFFGVTTDYLLGRTDDPHGTFAPDPDDPNAAAIAKIAAALREDPELAEFWDEISKREDLFLMFKQVRDLSPESIRKIIRVIKAIEDEEAE